MVRTVLERSTSSEEGDSLDGLLEIYRRHGFDAGYHQALQDQSAGLVLHAEAYLRGVGATVEERRLVYGLVARLQEAFRRESPLSGRGLIDGEGI